ncbi:MAG: LacI family transcriptional regulator [Lachnospiraceae bacterium]|nr:LacI family transcriptional regulator [Lachnospiraceae bacterium]
MSATIRDIKEQTGLALATISKYLNGGNVLPENRIKIEAAIKDLNYEVNEIARGLVTNKTRTVGVMVYGIDSLFNGTLLKYISEYLRKNGYGMLICASDNDEELEAKNLKFLVSKKVDGIIVIPVSTNSDFLLPAKNANVPVVLVDRSLADETYDCVKIDNRSSAYRAVNYLIEQNHKKIAVISSEVEYTGEERFKGYMDAMEKAGIPVKEEYKCCGTHSMEYGSEAMNRLMRLSDPPTAVFMTNYEITLGAVMVLNDMGKRIPDDVSLLGFDDLILSHLMKPDISVVIQPMKEMGEKAAEIILKKIKGSDEMPAEIVLGTRFSPGDSIRKL